MKISQEKARLLAKQLTQKSRDVVDQLKKEYAEAVRETYMTQVPSLILEAYKKHPEWFFGNDQITVNGNGFNHEYISIELPIICNNESRAFLNTNKNNATFLFSKKLIFEKAEKAYKALKDETYQTLLNLGTDTKIKATIPDAIAYLPLIGNQTRAIAINVSSLIKKLADQPSLTEAEKQKA